MFQPFFVERIFTIFDKNKCGRISMDETIQIFHKLNREDDEGKVAFLFKIYNINGNFSHVILITNT